MRRETLFGGIDTYRRAPRMLPACRPEKAARFVFAKDRLLLRSRQCAHDGLSTLK